MQTQPWCRPTVRYYQEAHILEYMDQIGTRLNAHNMKSLDSFLDAIKVQLFHTKRLRRGFSDFLCLKLDSKNATAIVLKCVQHFEQSLNLFLGIGIDANVLLRA